MSASKNGDASRPDVLLEQTLAMLVPWVRVLVANGVTYPQLVAALKPAFLRAAHAELSASGKRINDSAISIVSGVHRKNVRALTGRLAERMPEPVRSLVSEVIFRWSSDPRYASAEGTPCPLPLRNGNGGVADASPSFDQLTQSVSRDYHSRAVLEEMLRLRVVELNGGHAHLCCERSTADSAFVEAVVSAAHTMHSHLAAIAENPGVRQQSPPPNPTRDG